jgi:hypothetical protein
MNKAVKPALAVCGVYLILAVALLREQDAFRAIASGIVLFVVIAIVGNRARRAGMASVSVQVVLVVSSLALLLPALAWGSSSYAGPVGFFGMHAAGVLWATLVWRPRDTLPPRVALRYCLIFALKMAVFLSLVAGVFARFRSFNRTEDWGLLAMVCCGYVVGFVAIGVLFWTIQGTLNSAAGRYAIGLFTPSIFYAAVGAAQNVANHESVDFKGVITGALLIGTLMGPALGLEYERLTGNLRGRRETRGAQSRR